MTFRATGSALLITGFLGLTGCTSLSSLWPFHKPAPLTQVSTTETRLSDVQKQLTTLQGQLSATNLQVSRLDGQQWTYVSRMSYSITQAPTLAVAQAIAVPLSQIAAAQSPLTADDRIAAQSLAAGLASADDANRRAASDLLQTATQAAQQAHTGEVAAVQKVATITASQATLQVTSATLQTQLASQTKAAVAADEVKNQALATWNSIKLWFYVILALLVTGFVLSHLHLASIAKTLVK